MADSKIKAGLCAGVALGAMTCAFGAHAQGSAAQAVESVVVTGSRVVRDGTQAPSPVTVLTMENIQAQAPLSLANALGDLPQFGGSTRTTTNGVNTDYGGNNYLNLRNMGFERNLVLLDGKRVITTAATGGVDLNTLPEALVSRTEVVTGGASAAYGSGAVAGVLNLVIDRRFKGVKGEVQYGQDKFGENEGYKASIAIGGGFAADRGHFVASYEYARSLGIVPKLFEPTNRPWMENLSVRIGNPNVTATNPVSATNPRFIIIDDVRYSRYNKNGTILAGPLKNQQFNADGSLRPFNPGTFVSGTFASGGDGWNWSTAAPLDGPYLRENLYLAGEFEVLPNATIYADVLKSYNHAYVDVNPMYTHTVFSSGFPIKVDNAYLAASTRAAMQAAGLTQVLVNVVPSTRLMNRKASETGGNTTQANFGVRGDITGTWKYDLFYSYAQNIGFVNYGNTVNTVTFLRATDAVRNPAGKIVCRSTLTSPNDGCVPFNPLGDNVSSRDQIEYVQNDADYPSAATQEIVEGSITGDLFQLPAGSVSLAAGYQWRNQSLLRESDPASKGANPNTGFPTGQYLSGNLTEFSGEYTIKEFFGEVEVPLLKDMPLAYKLSVNFAGRRTDYSTSGQVDTWKASLNYEPFADLRFRATKSRDIRAPNLFEIFSGPQQGIGNVVDTTFTPAQSISVLGYTGGSAGNLTPEIGDTLTYGIVYRPSWAPGFSASIDRYEISVSDALSSLSGQQTLDQCIAGNAVTCANIDRDRVTRQITAIRQPLLNLAALDIAGYDFDFGYRTPIADIWGVGQYMSSVPGSIAFRVISNNLTQYTETASGATPVDFAGGGNYPSWKSTINLTYALGPFSATWQTRYIGEMKFDATLGPTDLLGNYVAPEAYTDISAKYGFKVGEARFEVFGVVSNIFEPRPPNFPVNFNGGQTNRGVYDSIGRQYRGGLRVKF